MRERTSPAARLLPPAQFQRRDSLTGHIAVSMLPSFWHTSHRAQVQQGASGGKNSMEANSRAAEGYPFPILCTEARCEQDVFRHRHLHRCSRDCPSHSHDTRRCLPVNWLAIGHQRPTERRDARAVHLRAGQGGGAALLLLNSSPCQHTPSHAQTQHGEHRCRISQPYEQRALVAQLHLPSPQMCLGEQLCPLQAPPPRIEHC